MIPSTNSKSVCDLHGNRYCTQQSALERYLVFSDQVHIHDILPVDDSRNAFCHVYFLDTLQPGEQTPACDCRLCYAGEEDQLLPVCNDLEGYLLSDENIPGGVDDGLIAVGLQI